MPARRNSLCKYVKASFQSCFWINMLWKWSWNNHPAPQSPTHTWLTRSQSIFKCFFIIHRIFFFLACLFFVPKSFEGCFLLLLFDAILTLTGLCVMVCFLSTLLLRVHIACYKEVRVDSYSVLACFGFYFHKDKGLDFLASEHYQCKNSNKVSFTKCWVHWVNLWDEC